MAKRGNLTAKERAIIKDVLNKLSLPGVKEGLEEHYKVACEITDQLEENQRNAKCKSCGMHYLNCLCPITI